MVEANASSIPVLTDVLVPGNPALARPPAAGPAQAGEPAAAAIRAGEGHDADRRDEATATEPAAVVAAAAAAAPAARDAALAPADEMRAPAPAEPSFALPAPDPLAVELPTAYPADATYADELPAAHPAPDLTPPAALPSSVPELAQAAPSFAADLEARQIAERLKSRMTRYLTGEGLGLIEARCRDALHDHAGWLVGQIAREVVLALETEVAGWVTEEVGAALARRNAPARSDTTQ
ncbi:DUF2486 family protein [Burkholderia pseudomallei]|uniref:DUF2486 family protein n=1 Tax=Burkholderia pseudomallei TaxID=28450 RepID=UPI00052AA059|nr:DUF2486 family protein [Burkholderia pseudomallei]AIV84883.1 hypothetical protein X978_3253 [Burkholderia pseudomallei MSHR3965]KGR96645.1 hypothetical protein X977_5516 [Burkholderia pseudomallei MSHR7504]KGS99580.1 hypothetical protein JT30_3270 [Burkholderia pseudomallei]KGW11398.1 hypothetical protein X980_2874 [Burkholderia pseudomallei MSHR4000]ONC45886.1 hypothetical protein AQ917_16745 [Burkholderia pseudomallei]